MKDVINSLHNMSNDNVDVQRRTYERRSTDTCMLMIDDIPHPVEDWSLSGVMFQADTRGYDIGDKIEMVLKFKMGRSIAEVSAIGEVVRTNSRFIATQFEPLSSQAQQILHQVIDVANAQTDHQSREG